MVSTLTLASTSGGTSLAGCSTCAPSSVSNTAAGASGATGGSAGGSAVVSAEATATGFVGASATVSTAAISVPSARIATKDNRRGTSDAASVNRAANLP